MILRPGLRGLALPKGNLIGGVPIGGVGAVGTPLEGMVLSWGDDFNVLNIVSPSTPAGRYFTTRAYGDGPRGSAGPGGLGSSYDTDPLHPGHLLSSPPYGFDNMRVANSILSLQARKATSGEIALMSPTAYSGGRKQVAAMIHGAGAFGMYPTAASPCIFEWRARYSSKATNPLGWHPTGWVTNFLPHSSPINWDEWDWEGTSQGANLNRNVLDNGTNNGGNAAGGLFDCFDGQFHTFALKLGASASMYVDGTLVRTLAGAAITKGIPLWPLLTSHILVDAFYGETYTEASWAASANGATMDVDWWRFWRSAGASHFRGLTLIPDLTVAYNGTGTITIPTVAQAFGDASLTWDVVAIPNEAGEPGVSATTSFTGYPPGVTLTGNTLGFDYSALGGNAGTINLAMRAWKDGATFEPIRFRAVRQPSPYDAATDTYTARMTTPATVGRKNTIDTLVRSLKVVPSGEPNAPWDDLDALYLLAAETGQAGLLNLISGSYDATLVNAPTFTVDRGYAGNGTSSYVQGLVPSGPGRVLALNSAMFGIWSMASGQQAAAAAGDFDSTQGSTINPRTTGDLIQVRINDTTPLTVANTDGSGLFVANRSGASARQIFKNGSQVASDTGASVLVSGNALCAGHASPTGYSTIQLAAMISGRSMTAARQLALYNAVRAYMQAVGAAA